MLGRGLELLYRTVEAINKSLVEDEPIKSKMRPITGDTNDEHKIYPRGSLVCPQATSSLCPPQPRDPVANWYHTPSLSLGATRIYPMVWSCNDTSTLLGLPFGTPRGGYQPLTTPGRRSSTLLACHHCPNPPPSRLGGSNHQE